VKATASFRLIVAAARHSCDRDAIALGSVKFKKSPIVQTGPIVHAQCAAKYDPPPETKREKPTWCGRARQCAGETLKQPFRKVSATSELRIRALARAVPHPSARGNPFSLFPQPNEKTPLLAGSHRRLGWARAARGTP
jgi:hypothetical protein